ncbi:hypothetical protein [Rickettsia fournieri]|uniref:hypothetical protein n=1 Tax=Rickettsia fournieri TaxID=1436798 RepID=UPI001AE03ADD|nr:hypothetical protein [Rickettsia fournieri]
MVLKGVKAAKAANTPVIAPVIVVAGGLPLPMRVGYNGLGMDGLVRKRNSLKPIVNLFPKNAVVAVAVAYIAPTSKIGDKIRNRCSSYSSFS